MLANNQMININPTANTIPASHPDRKLILACEKYCAAEATSASYFEGGSNPIRNDREREAAQEECVKIQKNLMKTIRTHRATTLDGARARAMAADACAGEAWSNGESGRGSGGEDEEIISYLIRDLVGPK